MAGASFYLKQSFVRAEAKIASHNNCQHGIKEHVEIVIFNARRIGTAHSLDRVVFTLVLRNEIEADWNGWVRKRLFITDIHLLKP